jgi:hypothetical protein
MARKMTEQQKLAQLERVKKWTLANPDRVRKNKKRYIEKHKERLTAGRKKHYKENAEKIRAAVKERDLKNKLADPEGYSWKRFFSHQKMYGLTKEMWISLFESQGNKCGCCGALEPGVNRWHTDHDHLTGTVRGILCRNCNHMIGDARDSIEILRCGIRYLEKTCAK